jgi:hypothetical protein
MKAPQSINATRRLLSRSALAGLGAIVLTVGLAGHVSDDALAAEVLTGCDTHGDAGYSFFLETDGTLIDEPGVGPGDTVQLSVSETTTTQRSEVHDFTSNFTWAIDGDPSGALSSAFVGDWDGGNPAPFTTANFTMVFVNAQSLGFENATQYNQRSGRITQVTTSTLASPFDSFRLTFKAEGR